MNPNLTAREQEIYKLLVETYLTRLEMSEKLSVCPETLNTHLMNIYGKLQAKSRLELVIKHWTNQEDIQCPKKQ